MGTDPDFCGHSASKEDRVIDPQTRGVRYAIVGFHDRKLNDSAAKPGRLVLDNNKCRFEPHAAAVTVGTTLVATNSDPVLHTTHGYGASTFNFALPTQGASGELPLDAPGLVMVRCDKHGWMNAFIRVDRHPFHAVTDAQGFYRIAAVPAGQYQFEIWHEYFGARRVRVSIEAGQTTRQDFTCTNDSPPEPVQQGVSP